MTYSAVKDMFDRLAAAAGFAARPQMLRHSGTTRWVRSGVDRDVVQTLLGHVSAGSMNPQVAGSIPAEGTSKMGTEPARCE
ncbi:site-specific integrase [Nocardia sp. NBC_00508]|uniref:site-specific integrase n=1 Tax=Nocardia sp. NBC_00508 TaxID=2975992 RepID=UPI002E80192A|nr:site-specific integrase [Nocardia sp. NBC_00508]WUD70183.1 site-specific integrase [Nocardia sp. NBC_00508]